MYLLHYGFVVIRTNEAYDESEEEDEEQSLNGSRDHVVVAQPGPGMKGMRAHSIPVRRSPLRRRQLRDEEEETESGLSETESEPASIASTRTDQTKYSAAQVPTVAVMAPSSGRQPQVPVRFRSSVHPVSSLPPIYGGQTSLVGVSLVHRPSRLMLMLSMRSRCNNVFFLFSHQEMT